MLTRLRLKNFKSWADTGDIALRPITGFFGTNSSGKTSLLQALLLLKQTTESSDRGLVFHFGDKASPVDLGDFSSLVHFHDVSKTLTMDLDWERGAPLEVLDTKRPDRAVLKSGELGIHLRVRGSSDSRRIAVERLRYNIGEAGFGMRPIPEEAERGEQNGAAGFELFANRSDFQFVRSVGRPWPLPPPVRCYGFPDQVRAYYRNAGFLADLELAFEECMAGVHYLGPLRAYPERRYTWSGALPTDMGRAGGSAIDAMLASRERGETISPGPRRKRVPLEVYVAEWLKRLGLIDAFRIVPLSEGSQVFQVKVKKTADSPEVLLTDVGFGVSQILPVLVLCFYVPEGSTVILEQPEIHLHPSVQAGLADVLIDAWKKRRVQIVLESHSEHLLRRLQRRIAEDELRPEEIGLHFCKTKGRRSELVELDIDLAGTIKNWPDDFFGDEMGEIAATRIAAIRRRRAAEA